MPDTRATTLMTVLGLALSAAGVWIAYSEHLQKVEARPALDVVSARVLDRSRLDLNVGDSKPKETDEIELTFVNRGTVEASDVTLHYTLEQEAIKLFKAAHRAVPILRLDNIPPTGTQTRAFADNPLNGDGMIVTTMFRGWVTYENRFNGKKYSETWCFDTSDFKATLDFPGQQRQDFTPIILQVCPTAY
jgi:hypothetical protein